MAPTELVKDWVAARMEVIQPGSSANLPTTDWSTVGAVNVSGWTLAWMRDDCGWTTYVEHRLAGSEAYRLVDQEWVNTVGDDDLRRRFHALLAASATGANRINNALRTDLAQE